MEIFILLKNLRSDGEHYEKISFKFIDFSMIISAVEAGKSRKACPGSKASVKHCTSGERFICNDATIGA